MYPRRVTHRRSGLTGFTVVTALVLGTTLLTFPASAASFADPFDRSDSSSLDSRRLVASTWGIRSNGARFLTGQYTSTTGLAVMDAGTTQVSVSADITLSPTPHRLMRTGVGRQGL